MPVMMDLGRCHLTMAVVRPGQVVLKKSCLILIALSHVDKTGYPAAGCSNAIRSKWRVRNNDLTKVMSTIREAAAAAMNGLFGMRLMGAPAGKGNQPGWESTS
jgi:hypothetical protein